MEIYVDLHIHSCLSPCSDDDMTPNNIVNMAYLKGLDAIAITDHNAAGNIAPAQLIAAQRNLVLLPGIEVQSKEEVHVLCYFPDTDTAREFSDMLHTHMTPLDNRPDIFGHQYLLDRNDEIIGEEPLLLTQSVGLSVEQLARLALERGGVMVPAHINRRSYALLANLGFIPPDLPIAFVEVHKASPAPQPPVSGYGILYSSDAHQLGDISEPEFKLEVPERSASGIIRALRANISI